VEKILVSACLLGTPVRYDGRAKRVDDRLLARWRAEGRLVPFCPEVSGGLAVPRPPAEIVGSGPSRDGASVLDGTAKVVTGSGTDVTEAFVRGAHLALEAAQRAGARLAVLKEGSPSCASRRVYDGTFSGRSTPGQGVTTALLERAGIRVFNEDELESAAVYLTQLEGRSKS